MLSRRQGNFVFIVLVAAIMSCVMSLAVTIANTGVRGDLTGRWLKAWAIGFLVALPTALLLFPAIRRTIDRFISR